MDRIPGVYRIDIQQGNVVDQEQVDQLQPGLSKEQVQDLLGKPLLIDVFHQDRWDYYYSLKPAHGKAERRRLALYFQDGRLVRLAGDIRPTKAAVKDNAAAPEPLIEGEQLPAEAEETPKAEPQVD